MKNLICKTKDNFTNLTAKSGITLHYNGHNNILSKNSMDVPIDAFTYPFNWPAFLHNMLMFLLMSCFSNMIMLTGCKLSSFSEKKCCAQLKYDPMTKEKTLILYTNTIVKPGALTIVLPPQVKTQYSRYFHLTSNFWSIHYCGKRLYVHMFCYGRYCL